MTTDEPDFIPVGPVRPGSIYVSYDLHKALGYLAKSAKIRREEVAERVLMAWLETNHKPILDHIEKQRRAEEEFQKTVNLK